MSRHVTVGVSLRWRHVLAGLVAIGACSSLPTAPVHAETPPDGRAYEMVTPVTKYQGGAGFGQRTTPDGNAVAYITVSAAGDDTNAYAVAPFIAYRTPEGWRTRSGAPIATAEWRGPSVVKTRMVDFSDDLTSVLLKTNDRIDPADREVLTSVPPGIPFTDYGYDLYAYDTATRGASWLTRPLPALADEYAAGPRADSSAGLMYYGASDDFRHVVFASGRRMTLDAPAAGMKLYERVDGVVRLVSVLPDDSPAQILFPSAFDEAQGATRMPRVSADGSRIFWTLDSPVPAQRALYMTENGETTLVSENSFRGGIPGPGIFMTASRDGSVVYFTSGATNLTGAGSGVHRWDRETGRLTLVARGFLSTIRAAMTTEDGSRLYFIPTSRALPEAGSGPHLYTWAEGEGLRLIGPTHGGGFGEHMLAVTPDGRYAYFMAVDHRRFGERVADGVSALYRYDHQTGGVVCASCRDDGLVATRNSILRANTSAYAYPVNPVDQMPVNVTDDGRLFFESVEPLVAHDVNGVSDVYEFDGTDVKLISSGRGDASVYVDNSADGSSVFFVTTNKLVAQDTDGGFPDVYVARVGGGFPGSPEPVPGCQGDSCQGLFSTPPNFDAPGSALVTPDAADEGSPTAVTFRPLKPGRAQLRKFAASGRIALDVRTSASGSVMVEARGRVGRRQRQLGQAWKRAARSGTVRVIVPLNRIAIGRLATRKPLRVTLIVSHSGAEESRQLGLRLERPARRAHARRGAVKR